MTQTKRNKKNDLQIIDLEENPNGTLRGMDYPDASVYSDDDPELSGEIAEGTDSEGDEPVGKWWRRLLNPHLLFLTAIVVIVIIIFVRFSNWGTKINVDEFFQDHELISSGRDTFDVFFPLLDESGNIINDTAPHSILFFGNDTLAENRDSEDSIVNMIAKSTGATVYNCAVEGSYLSSTEYLATYNPTGIDVYNFYFLVWYLIDGQNLKYFDWLESNPEATLLPDTEKVRNTLETIDMSTVDTIAIMYDGHDYLAGRQSLNPENNTDIRTFCGNLEAGLELLQQTYPNIRIIVLSPPYAFGTDENGVNISSDIKKYPGGEILSTYMLQQCESAVKHSVTYIDNIYGSFNEDEAPDYLRDNIHLNQKGRELIVKRFIRALSYYDKK